MNINTRRRNLFIRLFVFDAGGLEYVTQIMKRVFVASAFVALHLAALSTADSRADEVDYPPTPEQQTKLDLAAAFAKKIRLMGAGVDQFRELVYIVGDRDRLLILCRLHEGKKSEDELSRAIGVPRAEIVAQLRNLQDAGVIRTRHESGSIYYVPARDWGKTLLREIYDAFCTPYLNRCERDDLPYR